MNRVSIKAAGVAATLLALASLYPGLARADYVPRGSIAQNGPKYTQPAPDWAYHAECNTTDGSSCTWPSYSVTLPHEYSQNDTAWANNITYSLKETIGSVGCAMTSSTMIMDFFGNTYTPATFNTALGNDADDLVWATAAKLGGVQVVLNNGAPEWGLSSSDMTPLSTQGLKKRIPVVVDTVRYDQPTYHHYMVVIAVSGDPSSTSSYTVVDPYPNPAAEKNLASYLKAANRYVVGMVIYSR